MGFKILTVYVPVNSAQTIESSIDHVKNYFVYVTQRLSVPQNVRLFAHMQTLAGSQGSSTSPLQLLPAMRDIPPKSIGIK
jgi:hypothetical protein